MIDKLKKSIESFDVSGISNERKEILNELVKYVKDKIEVEDSINLNFICTHNSRRSHLSQVWAQAMAAYYSVDGVRCYSGGTEATAMFPMVGKTLIGQGFKIEKVVDSENPIYAIDFDSEKDGVIAFSKKYDDPFNPVSHFAAIMTCSSADKGCPLILGADERIPIMYEDPKISDGTPQQSETYLKRSIQIGTEMKYVFASATLSER